jgi:hypothetical protein
MDSSWWESGMDSDIDFDLAADLVADILSYIVFSVDWSGILSGLDASLSLFNYFSIFFYSCTFAQHYALSPFWVSQG